MVAKQQKLEAKLLDSRQGRSTSKNGLSDFSSAERDVLKLGKFGYIFEYWTGILLGTMYDDIQHEPVISIDGDIKTPDYQVHTENITFNVEAKSGVSCNGYVNKLEGYTKNHPLITVIHDEDTGIEKCLRNNHSDKTLVTTDDRFESYEVFKHTRFARTIRNKYDFLKFNTVEEIDRYKKKIKTIFREVKTNTPDIKDVYKGLEL